MLTYLEYAAFVRSVSPAANFFGDLVFGISRCLGIYVSIFIQQSHNIFGCSDAWCCVRMFFLQSGRCINSK
jgi:hypothetical protein